MSNRERAVDLLQMLPEEKILYAICFLEGLSVPVTEEQADPFFSEENMARLRRSAAEMEMTGGTVHEVAYDD